MGTVNLRWLEWKGAVKQVRIWFWNLGEVQDCRQRLEKSDSRLIFISILVCIDNPNSSFVIKLKF